jgi:hypothetical protein
MLGNHEHARSGKLVGWDRADTLSQPKCRRFAKRLCRRAFRRSLKLNLTEGW